MEIKITVKEIMDKGLWEEVCNIKGINVWAVNEGLLDSDEEITLSEKQAIKLGLL